LPSSVFHCYQESGRREPLGGPDEQVLNHRSDDSRTANLHQACSNLLQSGYVLSHRKPAPSSTRTSTRSRTRPICNLSESLVRQCCTSLLIQTPKEFKFAAIAWNVKPARCTKSLVAFRVANATTLERLARRYHVVSYSVTAEATGESDASR
jgi:hypothetical protein